MTTLVKATAHLAAGSVEFVEGVDDDVPVQAQDCNWGSLLDERKQLLQSTEMYLPKIVRNLTQPFTTSSQLSVRSHYWEIDILLNHGSRFNFINEWGYSFIYV